MSFKTPSTSTKKNRVKTAPVVEDSEPTRFSGCATITRLSSVPKGMTSNQMKKQMALNQPRTSDEMLLDVSAEDIQRTLDMFSE